MRLLCLLVLGLVDVLTARHHHHDEDDDQVLDMDRACPDGYFYAGEPTFRSVNGSGRDYFEEKGPTSPVYSCYRFIQKSVSVSGGSLGCNELQGQLVSINDDLEDRIVTSTKFMKHVLPQMSSDLTWEGATEEILTSGIYLGQESWTWFGADELIADDILNGLEQNSTGSVNCLTMRWENTENGTVVVYTVTPCTSTFNTTLCEVRVYTQVWYVWFYSNWLEILFFVAMGLLLICTCCMFQTLFLRKTAVQRQNSPPLPPPYTPQPMREQSQASRYAEKGREILAKVTFYKPKDEEKVKLSDA